MSRHVDYIHWSPVKHGLVEDPGDWPYSTYHDLKKEFGRLANVPPEDWRSVYLGKRP